jgi:hypothetical protein
MNTDDRKCGGKWQRSVNLPELPWRDEVWGNHKKGQKRQK